MADTPKKKRRGKKRAAPKGSEELSNLTRQLYSRDESATLKGRQKELSQLGIRRRKLDMDDAETEQPAVTFKQIADERAQRRQRILKWVLIGLGVLVVVGLASSATIWYRVQRNVTADDINVSVEAPGAFTTGEEVTYTVTYRNDSRVDWQSVEVVFEPPPGFTFNDSSVEFASSGRHYVLLVGQLPAGAEESFTVRGRLVGEQNASLVARAEVTITPENFPSGRFTKSALATTTITTVPLDIAVEAVQEAAQGERVLVTVTVTNTGTGVLSDVYVGLQPAVGMQLAVEDPQFSTGFSVLDSEWVISQIEPRETVELTAIVFVQGQPRDKRVLEVVTGLQEGGQRFLQNTVSSVIAITLSQLSIEQEYNGTTEPLAVQAGQDIKGVIRYANAGTAALKDVVITTVIEGVGFDASSLDLPRGAYNPTTNTITWTSATVPELALLTPQQQGQVTFDFTVAGAETFPIEGENTKNHAMVLMASIDSPDVAVSTGQTARAVSDRFVMSVTSDILLSADAFYDDGRLGIVSSGPVPPVAGETTSYTVRLRLGSTLNDVGDVRVIAVLPDGVTYTNQTIVTAGEIEFNDRTGEVVWRVATLPGLTGRSLPSAELQFQVSITPGEHQRNEEVPFLNKLTADGIDLFTDEQLTQEVTRYPTTGTASPQNGRVQ